MVQSREYMRNLGKLESLDQKIDIFDHLKLKTIW